MSPSTKRFRPNPPLIATLPSSGHNKRLFTDLCSSNSILTPPPKKRYKINDQAKSVKYDKLEIDDLPLPIASSPSSPINSTQLSSNMETDACENDIAISTNGCNNYVFDPESKQNSPNESNLLSPHEIQTTKNDITEDMVSEALNYLHSRSPGISTLPINYYKFDPQNNVSRLARFYNLLLQSQHIPTDMKREIKTAIPKYRASASSLTKEDPSNYRNLGLQNSLFKILDAIVKLQLDRWVIDKNLLHLHQGGFQNEKGTLEHIYVFQEAFAQTKQLYTAFIDLRKAYDTVWREGLFSKLSKLNAPQFIQKMTRAMLVNTTSVTKVNNHLSSIYATTNGLTQGSISSPMLFNLYINDLIQELHDQQHIGIKLTTNAQINCLFFADDIVLLAQSHSDLNKLLMICRNFFSKWKLELNPDKSKILPKSGCLLDKKTLEQFAIKQLSKKYYKYLGLPFSNSGLNRLAYFKLIKDNFLRASHAIARYAKTYNIPDDLRIELYKAAIRSKIEYGCQLIHYEESWLDELESMQIQAIQRLFNNIDFRARPASLLLTHNLETIRSRFETLTIQFFVKIKQNPNSIAHYVLHHAMEHKLDKRYFGTPNIPYLYTINKSLTKYNLQRILYDSNFCIEMSEAKHLIAERTMQQTKLELVHNIAVNNEERRGSAITMSPLEVITIDATVRDRTQLHDMKHFDKSTMKNVTHLKPIRLDKPCLQRHLLPTYIDEKRNEIWREILQHKDYYHRWEQRSPCDKCGITCDGTLAHQILECDKTSDQRNEILKYLKLYLEKNKKVDLTDSQLYNFTCDTLEGTHIYPTTEITDIFLDPPRDNLSDPTTASTIRTYLILLLGTQLPKFASTASYAHDTQVTIKTNKLARVSTDDVTENKHFVVRHHDNSCFVTHASLF